MLTFVMLLIGSKVQIFFEPETVWKDIFQHLSHPFATQYRLLLKCFLAARSKKYYSFFTRSAKFSCEIQILHQYDSFESHKVSFSSSQGAQSQKWNDLQHNNYIKLHAMPQTSEVCFTNIDFQHSKTMNENSMKYCGVKQKQSKEILRTPI